MTAPRLVLISGGRYVTALHRQAAKLKGPPDALWIRCADETLSSHAADVIADRGITLETPGASVAGESLEEAIRVALEDLRAPAIVLLAHTRCGHGRASSAPPSRDRLEERVVEQQRLRAIAMDRVARGLEELATLTCVRLARPALEGLVHLDETGEFLRFDPSNRSFAPLGAATG